ncbi:enoyl-CoA hydratase/isomerase family protein [Paraburkholderia sp.]|uniref:enoyl-CoA hydratase/isomerase family protein n=1 Tax=Paraburkholderia sp. TaxID=1926495 RepID=UPI0039E4FD34
MTSITYISTDLRGDVLVITLQRSDKLNAWNLPMREQLSSALRAADADADIAAVVLTGAGEKSFCAGADIGEIARHALPSDVKNSLDSWRRFYASIRGFGKPLVAALNGLAVGSGFQIALLADFRVAHADVRIGQVEINSGIPSITGSLIMSLRIGTARARELSLSGRTLDSTEALALGLIDRVVPREQVLREAIDVAAMLGSKSSTAVRLTKEWFRRWEQSHIDAAFEFAEAAQIAALEHGEMSDRTRQFVNRKNGSERIDE